MKVHRTYSTASYLCYVLVQAASNERSSHITGVGTGGACPTRSLQAVHRTRRQIPPPAPGCTNLMSASGSAAATGGLAELCSALASFQTSGTGLQQLQHLSRAAVSRRCGTKTWTSCGSRPSLTTSTKKKSSNDVHRDKGRNRKRKRSHVGSQLLSRQLTNEGITTILGTTSTSALVR